MRLANAKYLRAPDDRNIAAIAFSKHTPTIIAAPSARQ
jgi:hypothetical protein